MSTIWYFFGLIATHSSVFVTDMFQLINTNVEAGEDFIRWLIGC